MLSVKQGSSECQFQRHCFDSTRNQTRIYGSREVDGLTTRPSELLSFLSLELLSLHYASFPISILFSNNYGFPSFPSFPNSGFLQDALSTFWSFSEIFFLLFPSFPFFPISVFYLDFCHFRISVISDISSF